MHFCRIGNAGIVKKDIIIEYRFLDFNFLIYSPFGEEYMVVKINLMPEEQKKGGKFLQGSEKFYSLTLILFLFSLFCFSGLYVYKIYILQKKLNVADSKNSELTDKISNSFNASLISAGKKTRNAEVLLKDHLYWSKYFEILESFTLKNISYDQFSVKHDLTKNSGVRASIVGHAESFNVFFKQIAVFLKSKEFSNIKFNGAEIDKEGQVNFKIELEINQSFLKEKKQ